jgi:hypothetical protein
MTKAAERHKSSAELKASAAVSRREKRERRRRADDMMAEGVPPHMPRTGDIRP